ncbi:MAG: hypothetical protein CL607_22340 [Anaerolineaceae bacterium]|nr:hypothetical protein [Anaerolineaceae bacterium]
MHFSKGGSDRRFIYVLFLALLIVFGIFLPSAAKTVGTIYYVDAVNGSDSNTGTDPAQAWRTAVHALSQPFNPGDSILFRRGQIFSSAEEALLSSNGTDANPIIIDAYDTGAAPIIQNLNSFIYSTAIRIDGDHVEISNLNIAFANEFGLLIYGDYVKVHTLEISNTGIAIGINGDYALIENSFIHDLRMITNDSTPNNDYGAMGILINRGSNATITHNRFIDILEPSMDYGTDGAPFEIYAEDDLTNLTFAYNYIENCDNLFEAGSYQHKTISNILIHHNIIVECAGAVVVHAAGSGSAFEVVVDGIFFDNNTLKNTNIMWVANQMSPPRVFVRNNIFVYDAIGNAASHNGYYQHINNIYYAPDLTNDWQIGLTLDATERIVNPLLNSDYTLAANSPAIDTGTEWVSYPATDYRGYAFPQGLAPDIGAMESGVASPPTPTATLIPAPTSLPANYSFGLYQQGQWLFYTIDGNQFSDSRFQFGPQEGGWQAVIGDWNGDGTDDIGVYRHGNWMLRSATDDGVVDLDVAYGLNEDGWVPLLGDWNNDGTDTVGLFKDGVFLLRNSNTSGPANYTINIGSGSSIPIVGDWDGDGVDTVGVYSNGVFTLMNSNTTPQIFTTVTFGPTGWLPIAGDWNTDTIDTIGVFQNGLWRMRNSNTTGPVEVGFRYGDMTGGWQPLANYNGSPGNLNRLFAASVPTPRVRSIPGASYATSTPDDTHTNGVDAASTEVLPIQPIASATATQPISTSTELAPPASPTWIDISPTPTFTPIEVTPAPTETSVVPTEISPTAEPSQTHEAP